MGMTTSLVLSTKSPNKKQKVRFFITDIANQDFRHFLKKFKNSPYLGYNSKQVYIEPNEACFLLIKNITKLTKIDLHVWLHNIVVKSDYKKNSWTRQQNSWTRNFKFIYE